MITLNTNHVFNTNLRAYRDQQQAQNASSDRISTGKRVNHASQNHAQYVAASGLTGKISGFTATNTSIAQTKASLKVAISGAEKISHVLSELRAKAIQAAAPSLSSSAQALLIADMKKRAAEIEQTVDAAVFNGKNLIETDSVNIDATTFTPPLTLNYLTQQNYLTAADFDGDGGIDLAATAGNDASVNVFLNNGAGTSFTQNDLATGMTAPTEINSGDFNNDGKVDIAYTTDDGGDIFSTHVRFGNGDGSFGSEVNVASPDGTTLRLTVGDFNNDGIDDSRHRRALFIEAHDASVER